MATKIEKWQDNAGVFQDNELEALVSDFELARLNADGSEVTPEIADAVEALYKYVTSVLEFKNSDSDLKTWTVYALVMHYVEINPDSSAGECIEFVKQVKGRDWDTKCVYAYLCKLHSRGYLIRTGSGDPWHYRLSESAQKRRRV